MTGGKPTSIYSPNYTGTPVEAVDATDGVTVVGLDNSVAYRTRPGWVDIETYAGVIPEATELVQSGRYLGAHFTAPISNVVPDSILVIGLGLDAPRRPLAKLNELWIEHLTDARPVTIISPSEPIATSVGLQGHESTVSVSSESGPQLVRLAVLGNGSSVVLVIWGSPNPTINEAAYAEFIQSVRIDG